MQKLIDIVSLRVVKKMISYKSEIIDYPLIDYKKLIFDVLNVTNKDGSPSKKSNILGKLIKLSESGLLTEEVEFLNKYFINPLNKKDISKVKKMIISTPIQLSLLIIEIEKDIMDKRLRENGTNFWKDFKNIFINTYDRYRANDSIIEIYIKMLIHSKWSTCPICNKMKIVERFPTGFKFSGTLDHYFEKSDYPYLSLSFHNLIPVCGRCNKKKEDNKKTRSSVSIANHYHPYINSLDKVAEFDFTSFYTGIGSFQGELRLRNSVVKKVGYWENFIENTKEMYNLESFYSAEHVEVGKMWAKAMCYGDDFINYCLGYSYLTENAITYDGIKNQLLKSIDPPLTEREINYESLGKLKFDLVRALNLI